jgi:hypothetical protein
VKQLPISARGWFIVLLASVVVMIGAVIGLSKLRTTDDEPPLNTLPADTAEAPVSLNDLDNSTPPPMPGLDTGGGTGTGLVTTGSGGDLRDGETGPSSGLSGGTGGSTEPPPLTLDPPDVPVQNMPPVAVEEPRLPVVWVTETDAKAYSQAGFNMPVVRPLEQWEELQILESNEGNWDRVQDLSGQQFWVQKKVVTVIRPQNLSQPSVAEKKVMDFYTQVAHREHSDAYVHLSPEWKRELSFDRFVKGYNRTDSLRSEIVNVLPLGEDRFQVDVAMEAVEEGETVDYLGIYTVEKVDGKWYLTSGSLNRQASRF